MKLYKTVLLCSLLLGAPALKAQETENNVAQQLRADSASRNRIITRATMYGVGFTNVFDTYLSPQEYKGIDFRISRESMRMTRLMGGNVSLQSRAISSCLPEEWETSTAALSTTCATVTTPPKHVPTSILQHLEWLFGSCASRTVPSLYVTR